ncbi:hypothetical protein KC19_2G170600 [Ceratodon purpureus]|uniref:Uncharacterized protein n=1 Tax=Ceratodon purpureus TaxID=3225 RepID=A0A8T0IUW1_CERPU|nr:hypothetical protein KC19_2G170600 [Ceratodon purpureus]
MITSKSDIVQQINNSIKQEVNQINRRTTLQVSELQRTTCGYKMHCNMTLPNDKTQAVEKRTQRHTDFIRTIFFSERNVCKVLRETSVGKRCASSKLKANGAKSV